MTNTLRATTAAGVAALVLIFAGCRATMPVDPTTTRPVMPRENADLMAYIADQPFVTAEAGYRAAYVLWKGESSPAEFEPLADELVAGRVVGESWKHGSDDLLTRAEIAFMICRACKINSGLNWVLTGLGRYAWRELLYRDIAQGGSEFGYISGGEFLGILSRAEEYVRRRNRDAGPELGAAPEN